MVKSVCTVAVAVALILFTLTLSGCALFSDDNLQQKIRKITDPHKFSILEWEFDTLGGQLWESLKPASRTGSDEIETVREYFAMIRCGQSPEPELEGEVEEILARQIRSVLIEEGITNPMDSWVPMKTVFPPVNFEFEDPPHLLVVSPEDEIRLLQRTTLTSDLSSGEKEEIESQVDMLGYSSLVVRLGGVGFTYPTMVYQTDDIRRAIGIATEEWFHQYMAFKPLGFLYLLDSVGWRSDYDIITMNETVAGIVSEEIADIVYQKHYTEAKIISLPETLEADFDFSLEMRQIRITVDEYLAEGKVAEAEAYMNERRDFLASNGYHIRKLNQAYFAFHGTYADDPATASQIGQNLQKLREDCSLLKEFLQKVTTMTGSEGLKHTLEEN